MPLAQATVRETADSPRSRAALPVGVSCQDRAGLRRAGGPSPPVGARDGSGARHQESGGDADGQETAEESGMVRT